MARGDRDSYRELFEKSADAILVIEEDRFVDCNRAAVAMLRFRDKDELLQTHPSDLSPPTQPDGRSSFEKANEMIALAFDQGSHRFEWDHKRADGEVFPVEVLLTAIVEGGRRALHVVWRDITERKALEGYLRQAHKLQAVGRLTRGIAHDFNNLLVAIIGHSDLLRLELEEDHPLRFHADQIKQAGDRAAVLIRQLRAFTRHQESRPRILDPAELVTGLLPLLGHILGEGIRIDSSGFPEGLAIEADPGQIEHLLADLAANAREAMPRGGRLRIEMETVEIQPAPETPVLPEPSSPLHATPLPDLPAGGYLSLRLLDSGSGMAPDVLERVFEPFFTTREVGQGSGLGLSSAYGIVQQARGGIQLHSAPGLGTTVTLFLPLAESEAGVVPETETLPLTTRGEERILVVEDQESVSNLIFPALRDQGYEVHLASDGREALARLLEEELEVDLLVTDVVMPNLGGPELVQELRSRGCQLPVLFVSGCTEGALRVLEDTREPADLLEKPFTPTQLCRRIRRALDRKRPGAPSAED